MKLRNDYRGLLPIGWKRIGWNEIIDDTDCTLREAKSIEMFKALGYLVEVHEGGESVIDEPVIEEPVVDEPVIDEPAMDEPVIDEPAVDESTEEEAKPKSKRGRKKAE